MCVFLGYSLHHKGYICLDRHSNRLIISRHVTFEESSFPFSEDTTPPTRVAFDFLDDYTNPVMVPFPPSPPLCSAGTPAASTTQPRAAPDVPVSTAETLALAPLPLYRPAAVSPDAHHALGSTPSGLVPAAVSGGPPPRRFGQVYTRRAAAPAPQPPPGRFGAVYTHRSASVPTSSTPVPVQAPTPVPPASPAQASPTTSASSTPTPALPARAIAIAPVVNDHGMVTRGKRGFRQPALLQAAALSAIPWTYRAALADPNW